MRARPYLPCPPMDVAHTRSHPRYPPWWLGVAVYLLYIGKRPSVLFSLPSASAILLLVVVSHLKTIALVHCTQAIHAPLVHGRLLYRRARFSRSHCNSSFHFVQKQLLQLQLDTGCNQVAVMTSGFNFNSLTIRSAMQPTSVLIYK